MVATERVSILNSSDRLLISDYDLTAVLSWLTSYKGGVLFDEYPITPFALNTTTGVIDGGKAVVMCTRDVAVPIGNQKIMVFFQMNETKTLTLGTGSKVFIEISNSLLQDPTLIEDAPGSSDFAKGLNIGSVQVSTSRPTHNNYIKLWEHDTVEDEWIDHREPPLIDGKFVKLGNIIGNITTEGDVEAENITANGSITTPELILPGGDVQTQISNIVNNGSPAPNLTQKNNLYPGEPATGIRNWFTESMVLSSEATNFATIGFTTDGYKRQAIPVISSGNFDADFDVVLDKVSAPSENLKCRIELDSSNNPDGAEYDVNANGIITPGSLGTTPAIKTVAWAGSFTPPAVGTKYWIVFWVGTYGSETMNAGNYYRLYFARKNTTVRQGKAWNGTAWVELRNNVTDNAGGFNVTQTTNQSRGNRIITLKDEFFLAFTKSSTCTATRARILSDAGATLATATFSGNVATLSVPYYVPQGGIVRVEYDNNGSNYTGEYHNSAPTFPTGTNIQYLTGSAGGANSSQNHNIVSITTFEDTTAFFYISTSMMENRVYSLADARFFYKLPTDGITKITNTNVVMGTKPTFIVFGTLDVTGYTVNNDYFASNTPGEISVSPGRYLWFIGSAYETNRLHIHYKDYILPGTTYTVASLTATQTTSSTTMVKAKQTRATQGGIFRVGFNQSISIGSVSEAQIYRNGVAYGTLFSANSTNNARSEDLYFAKGDTIEVRQRVASGSSVNLNNFLVQYSLQSQTITGIDNIN